MDRFGVAEGRNLIVIQLESFQNFVINAEYNGQEITPNLNEIIKGDTIYLDRYYQQIGSGNTSDANLQQTTQFMEAYRAIHISSLPTTTLEVCRYCFLKRDMIQRCFMPMRKEISGTERKRIKLKALIPFMEVLAVRTSVSTI